MKRIARFFENYFGLLVKLFIVIVAIAIGFSACAAPVEQTSGANTPSVTGVTINYISTTAFKMVDNNEGVVCYVFTDGFDYADSWCFER